MSARSQLREEFRRYPPRSRSEPVALPTPKCDALTPASVAALQGSVGNIATGRVLRRGVEAAQRPAIAATRALRYNRRRGYPKSLIERIEAGVGAPVDGRLDRGDVETVADWQSQRGLTVDGMVGPRTLGALGLREEPEASAAGAPDAGVDTPHHERGSGAGPEQTPSPAASAEAEPPEPAPEVSASAAEDAIPTMAPEGTGELSAAVTAATEGMGAKTGHAARADALTAAAREYTKLYPELVKRYVAQPEPDTEEKVRVLGEVSVAIARMEMLLGTIYHKGGSWEETSNKGHMVDYFTGGDAGPWCTLFATSAIEALVGAKNIQTASGYKVGNAEEKGLKLDYSADQGGAFQGTRSSRSANAREGSSNFNVWQQLKGELEELEGDKRKEHAGAFLAGTFRPQAGDLLVMTRSGATTGSFTKGKKNAAGKLTGAFLSHTLMVERVAGTEMSVVEGNLGGRATGRTFDLSNPDHVGQIIFIARPSLETYGAGGTPDAELGGGEVSESDLKAPIADVNAQLLAVARAGGWVQEGARPSDVVADIVRGKTGSDKD